MVYMTALGAFRRHSGPHLKALYEIDSHIFKDTDILQTWSEIKHHIIWMSHLYGTK